MGGEDEALAISPPAVEHLVGLLAKGPVSDRQDLVDEEEVAVELRGDRKGQALAHAGGELLHLCLDEVLELRKGDDLVEALLQLRPAEADDRPIQEDVLAHRELVVHSRAQLEHGSEPPAHATGARGGAIDAGEDAEERALARAVIPDQPEGLAFVELEGHVVERSEPTRMPAHPERPAKLVEEAWRPCAGHTELLGQTSDLDQRLHHQMCSATSAAK